MSQRVLIAPLHWGLGHATRCVPLIERELQAGHEVIVSANGAPRAFLEPRFPGLRFVDIPFMTITYPADGNMVRHFFWRGPKLLKSIWNEHRWLQRWVRKEKIDRVISDSRFGLWTRHCHCVFVTHQLEIRSPQFQGLINRLNRWVMNHFDEVWIPDFEAFPGLAGELSHPKMKQTNAKYIGPLSRFEKGGEPTESKHWQTVAIISGPEPQRSHFETQLVRDFIEQETHALVLRGKPDETETRDLGNLKVVGHLEDEAFALELGRAERVVARSGYSTIMDLHALGVKADYVPTPGQTEQEYLAELHQNDQRR